MSIGTVSTTSSGRVRSGLPEIRLDLGAVQRWRDVSEPSELQVRREKLAFFEKQCNKVLDHLYVGGEIVARDLGLLESTGITHVLNCVGFVCPNYFPQKFNYKTLWLQDTAGEDILSVLYDVFDYLEQVARSSGRVFVHCCLGVSRSTALVIAYLMWRRELNFEDAFRFVKAARGVANPNMGFACQLMQWYNRIQSQKLQASTNKNQLSPPVPRLYQIGLHSHLGPRLFVPKALLCTSQQCLDPQGAFLLQVGNIVYRWQGEKCSKAMTAAADRSAQQIVRYEKLTGPVIHVEDANKVTVSGFLAALHGANVGRLDDYQSNRLLNNASKDTEKESSSSEHQPEAERVQLQNFQDRSEIPDKLVQEPEDSMKLSRTGQSRHESQQGCENYTLQTSRYITDSLKALAIQQEDPGVLN